MYDSEVYDSNNEVGNDEGPRQLSGERRSSRESPVYPKTPIRADTSHEDDGGPSVDEDGYNTVEKEKIKTHHTRKENRDVDGEEEGESRKERKSKRKKSKKKKSKKRKSKHRVRVPIEEEEEEEIDVGGPQDDQENVPRRSPVEDQSESNPKKRIAFEISGPSPSNATFSVDDEARENSSREEHGGRPSCGPKLAKKSTKKVANVVHAQVNDFTADDNNSERHAPTESHLVVFSSAKHISAVHTIQNKDAMETDTPNKPMSEPLNNTEMEDVQEDIEKAIAKEPLSSRKGLPMVEAKERCEKDDGKVHEQSYGKGYRDGYDFGFRRALHLTGRCIDDIAEE